MTGHSFITLYAPSLRYFYIAAHAQYFPVLVFNPIKCLHVLSLGLQTEYTTPHNPIKFLVGSGQFNLIDMVSCEFFYFDCDSDLF